MADEDSPPRIPPGTPQIPLPEGTTLDPELKDLTQTAFETMCLSILKNGVDPAQKMAIANHITLLATQIQGLVSDTPPIPYKVTQPDFSKGKSDPSQRDPQPDSSKEENNPSQGGPRSHKGKGKPSSNRGGGNNNKRRELDDDYNPAGSEDIPDQEPPTPRKKPRVTDTETLKFTKMAGTVMERHDINWMITARTTFYKAVLGSGQWAPADARACTLDFVNLIFTEMFGQSRQRVLNILRDYEAQSDETIRQSTGVRAEQLGQNTELPQEARNVFNSIAGMSQIDTRRDSDFGGLRRHLQYVRLLEAYNQLTDLHRQKDPTVIGLIKKYVPGTKRGKGIGSSTIVQTYITTHLGIEDKPAEIKKFQTTLNYGRAIKMMMDEFGRGVVVLLPRQSYYKLTSSAIGIRRLENLVPLLRSSVPWLRDLCGMLEEHVVGPIEQGASIPIQLYGRNIGNTVEGLLTQGADQNFDIVEIDQGEDKETGEGRAEAEEKPSEAAHVQGGSGAVGNTRSGLDSEVEDIQTEENYSGEEQSASASEYEPFQLE